NDLILSGLASTDLIRFGQVSTTTQSAVKQYTTRAFNLETFLSPWLHQKDIVWIRYYQSNFGMLIIGVSAFLFISRLPTQNKILQLCVKHYFVSAIACYLRDSCGYEFIP
ncbi:hypothetical protein C8J56DRAFT_746374, partial [Mycena floridula]